MFVVGRTFQNIQTPPPPTPSSSSSSFPELMFNSDKIFRKHCNIILVLLFYCTLSCIVIYQHYWCCVLLHTLHARHWMFRKNCRQNTGVITYIHTYVQKQAVTNRINCKLTLNGNVCLYLCMCIRFCCSLHTHPQDHLSLKKKHADNGNSEMKRMQLHNKYFLCLTISLNHYIDFNDLHRNLIWLKMIRLQADSAGIFITF